MVRSEKIPMHDECENFLEDDVELNKKTLGEVNELAYNDQFFSFNGNAAIEKVSFGQVRNVKSLESPKVNCKIAWNRLMNKYALHSASFLLKLKS